MIEKYSWAIEGLYKDLSAEVAAKELQRIRDKYGSLKPEYVVKESKDKNSVLHLVFEWNNKEAAEAYRIQQARVLIGKIRVEIVQEEVNVKIRAFVNVHEQENKPKIYVPIEAAISNDFAYNDLLNQAKRDMLSFVAKYAQLSELDLVRKEMAKAISAIPDTAA